jgi:uncharacterized FlgJ-related protein
MKNTLVLLAFLLPHFCGNKLPELPTPKENQEEIIVFPSIEKQISEMILSTLLQNGYDSLFATFVVAQAMHETGLFNSPIFYENMNLFGMKMPRKRVTYAVGVNRGHAVYNSYEECIHDYIIYLQTVCIENANDPVEFVRKLHKKKYFTDGLENYKRAVVAHHKKLKEILGDNEN